MSERGFEEPLASFDDKEDAYAFATELTHAEKDTIVLVEDKEGFSPFPTHGEGTNAVEGAN